MPEALTKGTWIKAHVPVSDSGDFNDRHAPAGAVGQIVDVRLDAADGPSYAVAFYPTFILNNWDHDEILREAKVLPLGHDEIPAPAAFELTSAIADMVADGDVDVDARRVFVTDEVLDRVRANLHAAYDEEGAYRELIEPNVGADGLEMPFEDFDALAKLAGIGDRVAHLEPARVFGR